MAHSEKEVIDSIANYFDQKFGPKAVEIHYRPHPGPSPRNDNYEILNPNVVITKYESLDRTAMPEMNDDFTGESGDQQFEFIGFESLEPSHLAIHPPCHPGSMGIGFMAGIDGISIRPHFGRAYKDHTHGFRSFGYGFVFRGWRRGSGNRIGGTSGRPFGGRF